jgi:hypothetical protein
VSKDNAADSRVDFRDLVVNGLSARRHALTVAALSLAIGVLAACGLNAPDPAGKGGLVGHISGTSDVAGQPGDPAIGGGGLAVIPIAGMDGRFWDLTGDEPVANPLAWSHLTTQLSPAQVTQLDGTVASIDGDGDFRLHVRPGVYAVCYWRNGIGGRVAGCSAVELPTEGEIKATRGEAGFHIGVVD